MKKKLRNFLEKIGHAIIKLARLIAPEPQEKRVIPWFKNQGEKTYRLDYDLNENSLVFDIGGYQGQWASDIFSKYCCVIHIFEPIEEYASQIESRFIRNPKIFIHKFGLSNDSLNAKISVKLDSSSIFIENDKQTQEIQLIRAFDFIESYKIKKIDLMKINIEGGEYDLLEHLIDYNLITIINSLQIQFHDFIPNAEQRMLKIQAKLNKTHFLTWQYPFVWENWQIKNDSN